MSGIEPDAAARECASRAPEMTEEQRSLVASVFLPVVTRQVREGA